MAVPTPAANSGKSTITAPQQTSSGGTSTGDVAGEKLASTTACPLPGGVLKVSAAPEIASLLTAAIRLPASAENLTGSIPIAPTPTGSPQPVGSYTGPCRVIITAVDPAEFIRAWQSAPADRPNVWIPDSSIWLDRATAAGLVMPNGAPSVVTSPAVLAISARTAAAVTPTGTPTLEQILRTRLTAEPVRIGLPDPRVSVPAVETLLAVQAYVDRNPAERSALTWAVGSGPEALPTQADHLLERLTSDPAIAVPVSEQAVRAYNKAGVGASATAVHDDATGLGLDYPFVVLSAPGSRIADAANAVLAASRTDAAGQIFAAAGFRNPQGSDYPTAATTATVQVIAKPPAPAAVTSVLRDVAVLKEPSRLLAVLDVSGSMDSIVPGSTGATRLDLAKAAATLGLALYPSDSEVGIWVFSRNLTPTTDYRELVPVGPLTAVTDGRSGAQRLGQAIAGTQVNPDGATGLYDTTLAAVRAMKAKWDPQRVNAVLILSDGQNDDQGGLSLPALLTTLQAEQDSSRPVPVITIGLGPDSDVDALRQISQATGGAAYVARDPRDIGQIFLDAVGQRLCRPHC